MKNLNKYLIILISLTIILIRLFYPKINFDNTSLILVGVIFAMLIFPKLDELFQRAKKVKFGSFEIELNELNKSLEAIETNTSEPNESSLKVDDERATLYYNLANDSPTEILKLSSDTEEMVKSVFSLGIREEKEKPISLLQSLSIIESKGLITVETSKLISDFWGIKNRIIYDNDEKLHDYEMIRFLDIGHRIIRILKAVYDSISDGSIDPK